MRLKPMVSCRRLDFRLSSFQFWIVYWIALTCISLCWCNTYLPIRINVTASMPRGIYWIQSAKHLHEGDFVAVCLPFKLAQFALKRGYLKRGNCNTGVQPLFKELIALSPETVLITSSYVQINHHVLAHSATLLRDSKFRTIPAVKRGLYPLKANQAWLYGNKSARSWDSRYFGPIDTKFITSVAKPLWIFSEGETQ